MTLVEGSAVAGRDLAMVGAERARAIMLLADRFTTDPEAEDLGILFQVWAAKSYTRTVPLFVQAARQATVRQVAPFLDPATDVIVSVEATRLRLLALSAVCPGASTLVGNLLRSAAVAPPSARGETLAGRRWLRQYVSGCEYALHEVPVLKHLAGRRFIDVAEWAARNAHAVLIGTVDERDGPAARRVRVNPAAAPLEMGTTLLVVAETKTGAIRALKGDFEPPGAGARRAARAAVAGGAAPGGGANGSGGEGAGEGADECADIPWGWRPDTDSMDDTDSDGSGGDTPGCGAPDADAAAAGDVRALMVPRGGGGGGGGGAGDVDSSSESESYGAFEGGAAHDAPSSASGSASSSASSSTPTSELEGHFIVCGHGASIAPFLEHLRRAAPERAAPVVVLAPERPRGLDAAAEARLGPLRFVAGSAADAAALRAAGAASARALVFLARGSRPAGVASAQATGRPAELERRTREAVLADADALLACYGVGEQSDAGAGARAGGARRRLAHAVVELLFTTSIEFLQPGLLLRGVSAVYDEAGGPADAPRKAWLVRRATERAAVAEGLAEWQANPYYAAGRVTVPALMDAFATQCFFNRGLLADVLGEMAGYLHSGAFGGEGVGGAAAEAAGAAGAAAGEDASAPGAARPGALLQQVRVPRALAGRTYGELSSALALGARAVALGLYRRKRESAAQRLRFVVLNPPASERVEASDRVFVLRERPGG